MTAPGKTNEMNEHPVANKATETYPGTMESVPAILEFVASYARREDFTELRIGEISKAVEEALGNIVAYAYYNSKGNIDVLCMIGMGQLMVIFTDYGAPFNMLIASDPLFEEDFQGMKRPSTRIMRKYMSSIESKRHEDKNVLTLSASRLAVAK
jgi:anti-sigma regulatory factor (Ser/Thr protein kinase)